MTQASEPMGNWSELVRAAGRAHADRIAMIDAERSITWSELDVAADAGAADLLESGSRRGDRALIALPSSPELVLALVAAARAGLVAVPVDPHRADLATVAGRVGARMLLAGDRSDQTSGVPTVLTSSELHRWWTADRAPVAPVGGGEDLAVLARASRSYRAVMISHRAVLAAVAAATDAPGARLRAHDRAVMALPVHHLAGLVTAFLPLAAAGAAAVFPRLDPAAGDLSELPSLIHTSRVTIIPGSPGVYRALLATDGVERALASVHLMTSGAAPLPPSDFSAVRAVTGQHVWEGYGISESTSVVASSLMTHRSRAGSVGRALSGLEIRIESGAAGDAAGDVAPPPSTDGAPERPAGAAGVGALDGNLADVSGMGDVGRISLRGATLFSGYWPDGADGPDEDGWFCTEDVGYLDDLGELHLVDRADETFTVAGFTVYPREIEQVLVAHPDILAAVVGAVPGAGSRPARVVAVLSTVAGVDRPDADALQEYVEAQLPIFKRPTEFVFVDAIPLTELGRQNRPAALALAGFTTGVGQVAIATSPRPSAVADAPVTPDVEPFEPAESAAAQDDPAEQGVQPPRGPEQAADLESLGGRLPGAGNRRARSLSDDDDLFGSDFS